MKSHAEVSHADRLCSWAPAGHNSYSSEISLKDKSFLFGEGKNRSQTFTCGFISSQILKFTELEFAKDKGLNALSLITESQGG